MNKWSRKQKLVSFIFGFFLLFINLPVQARDQGLSVGANVPRQGGGGADPVPPPVIVDALPTITNVTFFTTQTTATIRWSASDDKGVGRATFEHDTNQNYTKTGNITGTYQVVLDALMPRTKYYFRIRVWDIAGQMAEQTGTFETQSEMMDALAILNIQLTVGTTAANFVWDTNNLADAQVNYGLTIDYGNTVFDRVQKKSGHTISLVNLLPNTTYNYRLISSDLDGNSATTANATFTTQKDDVAPPNPANLQIQPSLQAISVGWQNPSLNVAPDFKGVRVVRKVNARAQNPNDGEIVYSGSAESFNDQNVIKDTVYFYTVFAFDTSGNFSSGIFGSAELKKPIAINEICDNKIDDNANGKIDCADMECSNAPECKMPVKDEPPDKDNSSDVPGSNVEPGKMEDGSASVSSSLPDAKKIRAEDLKFSSDDKKINLPSSPELSGLAGSDLTIEVPRKIFRAEPKSVVAQIDDDNYQLIYNAEDDVYAATIVLSKPGKHVGKIIVDYGDGLDILDLTLVSLRPGLVASDNGPVDGVEIKLFNDRDELVEFKNQRNPYFTNQDGSYGWTVPNGRYYLELTKAGFYKQKTPVFVVNNNIVNSVWTLISEPTPFSEIIDGNASVSRNIREIFTNLGDRFKIMGALAVQNLLKAAQALKDFADNPAVEKAASQVATPGAIAVTAVSVIPAIPWAEAVPLIKFTFFQPIILIGRRKRERWGQVYNALSKIPVDLAIVRLVDTKTGRIVQSRVTDKKGRYYFTAPPGNYTLQVLKNDMVFPSNILKNVQSDGRKTDIYSGQQIAVNENYPVISSNVPLDPSGVMKPPRKIQLENLGRKFQSLFSGASIVVSAASLLISPKWYVAATAAANVALWAVFRRLAVPPKAKSWGVVYNKTTKKPLDKVVVRLFSAEYNKLVSTQITDSKGRYSFLAGDSKFYVTYDASGFVSSKSAPVDLSGKEADIIGINTGLEKAPAAPLPSK